MLDTLTQRRPVLTAAGLYTLVVSRRPPVGPAGLFRERRAGGLRMRAVRTLAWSLAMVLATSSGCKNSTEAVQGGAVPGSILLEPSSVVLFTRDSQQLAVSVLSNGGQLIVGVAVSFASDDTTKVAVSPTGLVRSVGPTGQATVTVQSPPASRSVPVTVLPTPASLQVTPPDLALHPGDSARLSITVRDSSGVAIEGAPVSLTSDRVGVATVSPDGLVRAPGLYGQAAITVRSGPVTATIPVRVEPQDSVLATIPVTGDAYGIDVSAAGVVYATVLGTNSLARISLASLTVVGSVAVGTLPTGVAFSPNGATAYVTNQYSRTLGVVTVGSNSQTATVPVNADPFVTMPSPDGTIIAVTGNTDSVFIVDAGSLTVGGALHVGSAPNGLAFNSAGTRLYVSNSFGGTVHEINPATRTILRTFLTGGSPQGLAISGDGNELYVANEFGWLGVYSLVSGARVDSVPLGAGAFGLARSPDDAVLYVGIPSTGEVRIIARATHQAIKTLATGGTPRRIAFNADGRRAVIANQSGWVDVVAR